MVPEAGQAPCRGHLPLSHNGRSATEVVALTKSRSRILVVLPGLEPDLVKLVKLFKSFIQDVGKFQLSWCSIIAHFLLDCPCCILVSQGGALEPEKIS